MNPAFWSGRRVFLTGHTGFKGSWMALWLQSLGSQVSGYSLAAPTDPSRFEGRSRDVIKGADGADSVRAEARLSADLDFDRKIIAISADPAPPQLQQLIGQKGGGHLRVFMRDLLPDLIAEAHPLYLLLDDISGTSLVSNWGWSQWGEDWLAKMKGE